MSLKQCEQCVPNACSTLVKNVLLFLPSLAFWGQSTTSEPGYAQARFQAAWPAYSAVHSCCWWCLSGEVWGQWGLPHTGVERVFRKEDGFGGNGRLLFSTVGEGQTVILSFQVASFAKLASPALAGMESPRRLVPSPAFVLT